MSPDSATGKLTVSLVIPIRDEEASLPALIASIGEQTLLPTEVILVDAGSKDKTVIVARELTGGNARFHIVEAGPALPGMARNIGVQAARCEWIAFTDAGITLDREWLHELVKTAEQEPSADVVYGSFEPQINTLLDRCAALTWISPRIFRHGQPMRGPVIPSALLRKKTIESVGGFPDFRAAEDLIFMEKIEHGGYNIVWQPSAKVTWSLPPTLAKTFARFRLYSRHNIYAGRQRYWHYGVLRFYLAVALVVLATSFLNWRWAWAALPLALAVRAVKSLWLRRKDWPWTALLNPAHFLFIIVLLIVLDAATFTGWIEAKISN